MEKIVLYLVIASLTIMSIFGVRNAYQLVQASSVPMGTIASFDPEQNAVPGVSQIGDRIKKLIFTLKSLESKNRNWSIGLNAGVTLLTALAALIASIITVRAITKRNATITIAVLTFLSTLLNAGQSHFTKEKEIITAKIEEVRKLRKEMEELAPAELSGQLERYNNALDEIH